MNLHNLSYREKRIAAAVVAVAVIAAIAIYFIFDPSEVSLFPVCLFKTITGLDCPGCGEQRAFHAILHGDIIGAMRYNLMIVIAAPYFIVTSICWFFDKYPIMSRINKIMLSMPACIAWVVIIAVWFIVRNIFFPLP